MLANPTHTISSSLVQVFLVGGSSKYLHMVVKTAQSKHTACPCNYIVRMREDLTLLPCVAYSPRAGGRVLVCIPGLSTVTLATHVGRGLMIRATPKYGK